MAIYFFTFLTLFPPRALMELQAGLVTFCWCGVSSRQLAGHGCFEGMTLAFALDAHTCLCFEYMRSLEAASFDEDTVANCCLSEILAPPRQLDRGPASSCRGKLPKHAAPVDPSTQWIDESSMFLTCGASLPLILVHHVCVLCRPMDSGEQHEPQVSI